MVSLVSNSPTHRAPTPNAKAILMLQVGGLARIVLERLSLFLLLKQVCMSRLHLTCSKLFPVLKYEMKITLLVDELRQNKYRLDKQRPTMEVAILIAKYSFVDKLNMESQKFKEVHCASTASCYDYGTVQPILNW